MSSTINPVTIRILEKEYTVACPDGEREALETSAKRVDQEMRKVRKSGKVLGTDRIAVMVALNLAHELLNTQQLAEGANAIDTDTLERIDALSQRMDQTLKQYSS